MKGDAFRVQGQAKLNGTIQAQGAKNEALQVICATLMTEEEVIISNIPDILDVNRLITLIEGLGVKVKKLDNNKYSFQADNIDIDYFASDEYQKNARLIRGSVMLLGPLLARFKKAYLPKPGGDKIGRRRLDAHLNGFTKLGAKFIYDENEDKYFIEGENLKEHIY